MPLSLQPRRGLFPQINMKRIQIVFLASICILVGVMASNAQDTTDFKEVGPIRSSAAYAEVLLRRTELQADLESFLNDYTEDNPKVIETRFELGALIKDIDRLFKIRPSETSKLTLALGKMIVRRAALETDLMKLKLRYNEKHPEVLRAKRKVEIYAAALKEILG